MPEYTVYLLGADIRVAEAELVASELPEGAQVVLVTTDQAEVEDAIRGLVLEQYRWAGNEWLSEPYLRCGKCQRPAEPDGQGGYRHVEPVDAAACEYISGGGLLSKLVTD